MSSQCPQCNAKGRQVSITRSGVPRYSGANLHGCARCRRGWCGAVVGNRNKHWDHATGGGGATMHLTKDKHSGVVEVEFTCTSWDPETGDRGPQTTEVYAVDTSKGAVTLNLPPSTGDIRLPSSGTIVGRPPADAASHEDQERRRVAGKAARDAGYCLDKHTTDAGADCWCREQRGHSGDHYDPCIGLSGVEWPQEPAKPEPAKPGDVFRAAMDKVPLSAWSNRLPKPEQPGRDMPPIIGRLDEYTALGQVQKMAHRHDLEPEPGEGYRSLRGRLREHVNRYTGMASNEPGADVYLGMVRTFDSRCHYRRDDTGRWRLRTEDDSGWEDER